MPILLLTDLRGGVNTEHPATIEENQVAAAWDVDYFNSYLCGRRNGSTPVLSGLTNNLTSLIHFTPDSIAADDQLWTFDNAGAFKHYPTTSWTGTAVVPNPNDTFLTAAGDLVVGASLHGKLFLAAKTTASGVALNRVHVWDGTTLRRAGLAAPTAAPNVANEGVGSFTITRYYRVRFAVITASVVQRRSDPSAVTTFAPSGTGAGARITIPPLNNEGENYWEVEESLDQGNWYRIATVLVGTTTYDDTLASTAVASTGTLSDDAGDDAPMESVRYLAVDRDRLVGFGNYEDPTKDSYVVWTPVGNDPGVGNDERVPVDTGNFVSLDGQDGGPLTGGNSYDARIIAFKLHRTYSLTNTGIRQSAYLPNPASRTYGALPLSNVEGVDAQGRATLYFVDNKVGPMALGANDFQILSPFLQKYFLANVNLNAVYRVTHAVYHADRKQVWWNFAGLTHDWPSFRWIYDVRTGGVTWFTLPGESYASVIWLNKPYFSVSGKLIAGDADGVTSDYGNPFRAYIQTRSYELGELANRVKVSGSMIEGITISGVTLVSTMVRDYGIESITRTFPCNPRDLENVPYFISQNDSNWIQQATVVQIEIGDATAVATSAWQLDRMAIRWETAGKNI